MNKFSYVNQLEKEVQDRIVDEIQLHLFQNEGLALDSEESKEAIKIALRSHLIDLENVVDIEEYL